MDMNVSKLQEIVKDREAWCEIGMSLSKLQEILKDKDAWHTAVHGFTKSQMGLSN